jgi:YgiT-type zinc finger domain-containing protein
MIGAILVVGCPVCGVGELDKKTVEDRFIHKGEALSVPDYEVLECAACGEAVVDPASSKRASDILKIVFM